MSSSKRSSDTVSTEEKRKRLLNFSLGKYASTNAIASILKDARDGIPEAASASSIHRARVAMASAWTPYGSIVQPLALKLTDKNDKKIDLTISIQRPIAYLYHACAVTPTFAALMRVSLARKPSTVDAPWRILLYNDEVGLSPLKHDSRKTECFYWSFLELGMEALSTEEAWFCTAAIRSDIVAQVDGGVPHITKLLLRTMFATEGNNMATTGAIYKTKTKRNYNNQILV